MSILKNCPKKSHIVFEALNKDRNMFQSRHFNSELFRKEAEPLRWLLQANLKLAILAGFCQIFPRFYRP